MKNKEDICHLCMIPMTGLGLHGGYRGDTWFKYRIELFKNYTLQSLLNQTNRNFTIWLSFRPEERDNPICQEFERYMRTVNQPSVFTYGGLMFYDDKFEDTGLLDRLKVGLPELKEKLEEAKYVYETLTPSDDLYHQSAIDDIQNTEYNKGKATVFNKGFMHNTKTQRVAEWNPETNPPFYTIMYPADVFFDPVKHFEYMKDFKSHEDIARLFECVRLPNDRYCVLTHEKNISTNYYHPFRGKEYQNGQEIMRDFGVEIGKPSKLTDTKVAFIKKAKYYGLKFLIITKLYGLSKKAKNSFERRFNNKDR